ncbi:MAG: glutaredoxin family protein [Desulfobacteraceae bacterium]|nr:MAG: glutaredoxin family protein [Desulfobacteraceae bacterium]
MLNMYAARWCPHCRKTEEYLMKRKIEFNYIDIEVQQADIVSKVIKANGGFDWVVPTLEYNGIWREGKVFNETELARDLMNMGIGGHSD